MGRNDMQLKRDGLIKSIIFAVCLMVLPLITVTVYAAPGETHFGSPSYEPVYDTEFPIGVYFNADVPVGDYEIVLSYDTKFLEYIDGATEGGDGKIVISGNLQAQSLRVLVNFRALAVGDTSLEVVSVTANNIVGDDNIVVDVLPIAPISITNPNSNELQNITINGESVEGFSSENMTYEITAPYAEDIQVLGDGTLLDVVADEEVDGEQTLYATYIVEEVPVIYTFHIIWDKSNYVEETVEHIQEENAAENEQPSEGIVTNEEAAQITSPEKSTQEVEQMITQKKENDMMKAAVVLGGLFCVMIVVIIIRGVRLHRIRKSFESDSFANSFVESDLYDDDND